MTELKAKCQQCDARADTTLCDDCYVQMIMQLVASRQSHPYFKCACGATINVVNKGHIKTHLRTKKHRSNIS